MDFWRKKKEEAEDATEVNKVTGEAAGSGQAESTEQAKNRSTALALRPIPEDALILIPLRNAVLFPHVISPVTIGRATSIAASRSRRPRTSCASFRRRSRTGTASFRSRSRTSSQSRRRS